MDHGLMLMGLVSVLSVCVAAADYVGGHVKEAFVARYGVDNTPKKVCERHHVAHSVTERCPDCRAEQIDKILAERDDPTQPGSELPAWWKGQ